VKLFDASGYFEEPLAKSVWIFYGHSGVREKILDQRFLTE
jgi:hypothetical protein